LINMYLYYSNANFLFIIIDSRISYNKLILLTESVESVN
jgi:hypothetical protein